MWRTKGGMNKKLRAFVEAQGRPIRMFVTAGPISDCTETDAMLRSLPQAEWVLADRGYDVDWFKDSLKEKRDKGMHPLPER